MVSAVRPPPSPLPPLSSPPPQAATPAIVAANAATPTIVLCMAAPPRARVTIRITPIACAWQRIQRALNGPDPRLPRGGPRSDAAGVLAAVGDDRAPAHAPGPGGVRRPRAMGAGERGAPARLRLRRAARAGAAGWLHPRLPHPAPADAAAE